MEAFRSAFDGFVDWELPTAKALREGCVLCLRLDFPVERTLKSRYFTFGVHAPPPSHFAPTATMYCACIQVCRVGFSGPHQGLTAHIGRYRNSPVMHKRLGSYLKGVLLSLSPCFSQSFLYCTSIGFRELSFASQTLGNISEQPYAGAIPQKSGVFQTSTSPSSLATECASAFLRQLARSSARPRGLHFGPYQR